MAPTKSNKKGKGRATNELDANGRPPKIKRVKEVVFDADARKSVPCRRPYSTCFLCPVERGPWLFARWSCCLENGQD